MVWLTAWVWFGLTTEFIGGTFDSGRANRHLLGTQRRQMVWLTARVWLSLTREFMGD